MGIIVFLFGKEENVFINALKISKRAGKKEGCFFAWRAADKCYNNYAAGGYSNARPRGDWCSVFRSARL